MLIYLMRNTEITSLCLPSTIQGTYWTSYKGQNGHNVNLISIEANQNHWVAKSNADAMLRANGTIQPSITLELYNLYEIKTPRETMYLFTMPNYDETFKLYHIENTNEIIIGNSSNNTIVYNSNLVSSIYARISKTERGYSIFNMDNHFGTYVNKVRILQKDLVYGDVIFIMGLKIIFMGEYFAINNPNNSVTLNNAIFSIYNPVIADKTNIKEDPYIPMYRDEDYFEKSPRFITQFEKQTVKIDTPPDKKEENETPILYTIGPMMTMGMVSMVTGWTAINRIIEGGRLIDAMPSLVMSFAMVMTMVFWPILSTRFQRKMDKIKEAERQKKYKKYLTKKSDEIQILMRQEKQVLMENNVSLEECQNIILNKKRNLWEKEIYHKDFLTVRLGTGSIRPSLEIVYPEEHFSLTEDNLKELVADTISRREFIDDVPVRLSLAEKNLLALIGDRDITNKFLESILIQLMTFHSYRDLKIVFLTNGKTDEFSYLKLAPYLFDNNIPFRFYGDNYDDIKVISNYLMQIFNSRKYTDDGKIREEDYKSFDTYYLIIVDDLDLVRKTTIIKEILHSKQNYGFSLILRSHKLSTLPKECSTFVTISGENGKTSGVFENELTSDRQQAFAADLNVQNRVSMSVCIEALAKIPLRMNDSIKSLPKTLSFLEMYDAGKVEQLNASYRWADNNPTISLNVPIGIDESGELLKLDLHERSHGPHGLIAGMTGSGKSELIITYILSLAVNFHPYEVSFVLIDYKGGGLAGAFENRETGVSLPHLAGTITNLDSSSINRALSSIRSELRRRQKLFNEARDKLGESTIDIYKYQKFYREGLVEKPVSHLFIISDEFAELKMQQPDFMKELISTARIGRSLGVHLILSTQKPSGIVDDQIWSNSKFRICLKVQDKADSKDMLGLPDAASLVEPGRFYLQVGYNELFVLGQSAWCSSPYYPEEKRRKKVNTEVSFIDNIGNVIKSTNDPNSIVTVKASGEELNNVLKYLVDIAKKDNIKVDKLWLNALAKEIFVADLYQKYEYKATPYIINPVIGEFDDPNNQRQGLLTLPLSKDGNTIIYGTADSGKEDLLLTMIYSTITYHSAEEVNFYILDFGSELLKTLYEAPQVGDVVSSSEEEKVNNLFKMLNSIIDTRKQILAQYNGDFKLYNEKSDTPLSNIIVVINNYEAFAETYEACNEMLTVLSRECVKYGIILVLTATSPNTVRYKLSQNFKQLIPLQLNDNLDYTQLLGKTNGLYPAENRGRGLVKLDSIYEFQTAYIKKRSEQIKFLENVCQELRAKAKFKARTIPVLPDKVTLNLVSSRLTNSIIPLGICKDNLAIATYNFKANYTTMISSIDSELFASFVNPLLKELIQTGKVIVIDAFNIINPSDNIEYYSNQFDSIVHKLKSFTDKFTELYEKSNYDNKILNQYKDIICVVTGVGTLYNRLSPEAKKNFEAMMKNGVITKKITYIFVDTADVFKGFEYNDWYKAAVTRNGGIWIGNGLGEQMAIKVSKIPRSAKDEILSSYGFVIDKGMAKHIKLIIEEDKNGK